MIMDIYIICALLLTTIFSVAGVYLIIFLRSTRRVIENVDSTLNRIRVITDRTENVVEQAEVTMEMINHQLPTILEDLGYMVTHVKSISENADIQFSQGSETVPYSPAPSLSAAASFGNYVLKGYSVWRKFKKYRFPV
jgi:uncharacterized protein YoxC